MFPTATAALERLQALGIVEEITGKAHGRIYTGDTWTFWAPVRSLSDLRSNSLRTGRAARLLSVRLRFAEHVFVDGPVSASSYSAAAAFPHFSFERAEYRLVSITIPVNKSGHGSDGFSSSSIADNRFRVHDARPPKF